MAKGATEKQLDYIEGLAEERAWEKTTVRDSVKRVLAGEDINVISASRTITVLLNAPMRDAVDDNADDRLLTVEEVIKLVCKLTYGGRRPAITNEDQAREWVLTQLAQKENV